ncbi:ornithine carbamoyltransferase [Bradyrhizobium sp. 83012]|uniref:Ornithine carbamoyltransferase n=1 Tax=Bradyrhizobium aeschynomenes TaxID=2734909 RepID=A0ABX2CJP5_9BRAD|nr:ornithine carbamoyltransferase [Bradyrhizobium aeschynomenes]NPU68434.1 ornithine carbamoyltransferase [Bradyrhizobium aeschynomenes]
MVGERDILALGDLDGSDILGMLMRAQELAACWRSREMPQTLAGRRIALVVDDGGWRNTTAFDLGVRAMGGLCVHAPIRLNATEAVEDLAAYLDNWFDAVVCRTPELELLYALSHWAQAPVINARTRQNHPCETLGDLAFLWHRHGTIDGLKIAVVAPAANILGSWIEAAQVLPIDVVQVYPARWHAPGESPRFHVTTDLDALQDADVIVTDCWPRDEEPSVLQDYQITASVLDSLRPNLDFLPCPPVTRGQEVSGDAMLHQACRSVQVKAFLLHAQNAALEWVFGTL